MAYKDDARRLAVESWAWQLLVPTRFADMDPNRHLNNTAIARLCEEGRVRFHWHLRKAHPAIGHPHFLVAHVGVDYLAEGHYPHDVTLGLAVTRVGSSSYTIAQGLFQVRQGALRAFALAESVLVHRDEAMRPLAMPAALTAALGEYGLR
ncbi:acyl-CoA thioesterase [Sandaracinobacteroides saxicola]|uniref:Acyl-CoA thioesterase n=1 Tax=Sandaracinobacteroides saxicola TaxID=2759707 RepID=A0A7G5IGT7_9SPHN|nr:thioesterase family protein [Sandaracinobacteroides saxicola]QMW22579.1 hypothetical protein H3309_14875 [Sandaracinobacteroides saxicola]